MTAFPLVALKISPRLFSNYHVKAGTHEYAQ